MKTIDNTDISENGFNYGNKMICLMHKLIREPKDKPFPYVLSKVLFYKILRMFGVLAYIDDRALK